MIKRCTTLFLLMALLVTSQAVQAQGAGGVSSSPFMSVLLAIVVIIAFFIIVQVADNLLRLEARKTGADKGGANFSIFPGLGEIFKPKAPAYANGSDITVLKKGFEIKLEGAAQPHIDSTVKASTFCVQPNNFRGLSPIPKMLVEVGDTVKAGDHLFFDKKNEDVKYVAPVSGEIIAINRGDRRAIVEVVILADKDQQYKSLPVFDLEQSSREALVAYLMENGGWTFLRQRPYDIIANHLEVPDNIFISTFDSAPLAPDNNFVVEGRGDAFQKGLEVLAKLTKGKVHLGLNAAGEMPPSSVFTEAKGVEKHWFQGQHPSGNVGIQIHHISPITPRTTVWTLGVQEVISLGAIFTEKRFNAERIVAITGAELQAPKYVRTFIGANVGDLVKGNLTNDHVRFISGDVLSGKQKGPENFLNYYDDQLTVVTEGDFYEIFGWLLPDLGTPSASKALPGWLFPDTKYTVNTNLHGEKRAFVVTGQYEDVLPMDIYPQHLMKAIITNDYEKMEGLGIHELVEEDLAICEYVCTSKQPLQQILRQGLDMMHEQG
ncbi:MAG: Na(+)-translocating NADH-quinone reductase subunit A [Saprospiraceae bacterium]